MGSKRYPVSDLKRTKLARKGVVSRSTELLALGALLGLGWSVYLIANADISPIIDNLKALASSSEMSWDFFGFFMLGLITLLLPAYILILLISLVQTKFNFSPGAIGFSVESFGSLAHIFKPKLAAGFNKLLLLFASCLAAYILAQYLFTEVFSYEVFGGIESLRTEPKAEIISSLFYVWLIVLFLAFFIGTLSFFLSRLAFDREHMMTREEVEEEAREYESSPEVRQAQKELMS